MKLGEAASEEFVAGWLVENGGYDEVKGPRASRSSAFEPVWSIDTEDLFAFIGLTEADAWHRLVELHGSDPGEAQARVIQRPATELDRRGSVDVLRHDVVNHEVTIRLAFFKPAHGARYRTRAAPKFLMPRRV